MTEPALLQVIEKILTSNHELDTIFSALLPALGELLQCDRCFLYLRDPHTQTGKVVHWWRSSPKYPELSDSSWSKEPASLAKEDPLFAAALGLEASIFVEDVETASAEVVNLAFEQTHFGHRALIHSHLCQNGMLWGILQPCVFDQPRVWSEFDRSVISQVEQQLTPIAVAYIQATSTQRVNGTTL